MVVDDQAIIRRMVHAVFEAEDVEVCDATNGAEGVQRAQELNPDLVILDMSMPVMNGLQAARALKQLMPQIPLLMFTNHVGTIMEAEARSAGIFALVCKTDSNSCSQLLKHARALLD